MEIYLKIKIKIISGSSASGVKEQLMEDEQVTIFGNFYALTINPVIAITGTENASMYK